MVLAEEKCELDGKEIVLRSANANDAFSYLLLLIASMLETVPLRESQAVAGQNTVRKLELLYSKNTRVLAWGHCC